MGRADVKTTEAYTYFMQKIIETGTSPLDNLLLL